MAQYVLEPLHGAGRGRLGRHQRAVVLCVADGPSAVALVGWCRVVGDRDAEEALGALRPLATARGVVAVAAFVLDDDGAHALVSGGVPLFVRRGASREPVPNQAGDAPVLARLG